MDNRINVYLGLALHPGQIEVYESPARFRVLDCGRRWGKTVTLRAEILRAVSEAKRIAYMCPTYKMLADMWRIVKNMLAPITKEKKEDEHRIETINGAVVEMWSLDNPDGPRGREYDLVLIDEAAVVPSGDTWQEVIRPMLMTTQGRALFASTPKGYNWFWNLYRLGKNDAFPDWESWHKPSSDNPFLPASEIEDARKTTPVNIFSQEYLAEFISDAGSVFRNLEEMAQGFVQAQPKAGHTYVIGVDLAKTNDFSVFTVIDVTLMSVCYIDRANHVDYKLQKGRIVALANLFHAAGIIVEQNTNLAFMESLMDTGLPIMPFTTSGSSKALIIEALAAAFDNRQLQVLHKGEAIDGQPIGQLLLDELHAFQMERLPSGAFRYSGPRDSNDDMVMSLALAYHGATYGVPKWAPELIDIPHASQGIIPADVLYGNVQFPPPPPIDVAWPTAEYIFL